MSYSFTTSIGDGVTKIYPFSFAGQDLGYLAVSNVVVFVAGVPVPFTIPSNDPNKAYLISAPPVGAEVLIRRVMPKNVPYSDFSRGNPFSQDALNNTNLQQLYIVQEILDGYMPTGFYFKSDINMGGYKLVNLGEGTQAGDSVRYEQWLDNKERLDRLELGLVDNVAQRTIPWYYIATGGEVELSPPYDFQAAIVFRGGVFQNQGLGAFSITNNKIKVAEPLDPKEEFYALLGSSPATPDDYAKLTEVIKLIESSKNTRELWSRSLAESGLTLVQGSFREGAVINNPTEVVWDEVGAQCYKWSGGLPLYVDINSTPSDSRWVVAPSLRYLTEYSTVAEAQGVFGFIDGQKIRTYKHNVDVVSDWVFTKTEPSDTTFHIPAMGGYLILLTSNFASAGIISGNFNPETAWHNRNTIHKLIRDTRFSTFNSGTTGTFYILGTVHPNRSDINIIIDANCKIIGRYDDISIPESAASQTGEMFGFPIRAGYDSGDFTTTGTVKNVKVEIIGELSTEFSMLHSSRNNNNVIGFLRSENCHVIGTGGVGSSDHKGICFDGDAVNCSVDVGYVLRTMDEQIQLKGAYLSGIRNLCKIRVGSLEPVFGGTNPPVSIFVSGCNFDIDIGVCNYFGSIFPVLVGAFGAQTIKVKFGHVGKASQIVRLYNTEAVTVDGGTISAVQNIVTRGGDGSITPRLINISNIIARDNILTSAYREDSAFTAGGRFLTIHDCDFTPVSTSFKYLDVTATPSRKSIYNNISRQGMPIIEYNPTIGVSSRNVITAGARVFTYDAALPDFIYSSISLTVTNSLAERYTVPVNVKTMIDGNIPSTTFDIGGVVVKVVRDLFVLTISTETVGANFYSCVPFN